MPVQSLLVREADRRAPLRVGGQRGEKGGGGGRHGAPRGVARLGEERPRPNGHRRAGRDTPRQPVQEPAPREETRHRPYEYFTVHPYARVTGVLTGWPADTDWSAART